MTNSETSKAPLPSTQTLYRITGLRKDYDKVLQATYRITEAKPTGQESDAFRRIIEATSIVDVVRMAQLSRGVAQLAWVQRMNEFGVEALPAIVRRLKSSQSILVDEERHIVTERLIGALRRLDAIGGQSLLDCFNNLDLYSQSLACVVFGLVQTVEAAEPMLRFYQRVKTEAETGYLVGALWGLIGVHFPQVDEIMAGLMNAGRTFAEQYPFASLAGGEATLRALTRRLGGAVTQESYDGERDDVLIALSAIGHRLGMDRYRAVLDECVDPAATVQSIMDVALRTPPERTESYFKMYYIAPDRV